MLEQSIIPDHPSHYHNDAMQSYQSMGKLLPLTKVPVGSSSPRSSDRGGQWQQCIVFSQDGDNKLIDLCAIERRQQSSIDTATRPHLTPQSRSPAGPIFSSAPAYDPRDIFHTMTQGAPNVNHGFQGQQWHHATYALAAPGASLTNEFGPNSWSQPVDVKSRANNPIEGVPGVYQDYYPPRPDKQTAPSRMRSSVTSIDGGKTIDGEQRAFDQRQASEFMEHLLNEPAGSLKRKHETDDDASAKWVRRFVDEQVTRTTGLDSRYSREARSVPPNTQLGTGPAWARSLLPMNDTFVDRGMSQLSLSGHCEVGASSTGTPLSYEPDVTTTSTSPFCMQQAAEAPKLSQWPPDVMYDASENRLQVARLAQDDPIEKGEMLIEAIQRQACKEATNSDVAHQDGPQAFARGDTPSKEKKAVSWGTIEVEGEARVPIVKKTRRHSAPQGAYEYSNADILREHPQWLHGERLLHFLLEYDVSEIFARTDKRSKSVLAAAKKRALYDRAVAQHISLDQAKVTWAAERDGFRLHKRAGEIGIDNAEKEMRIHFYGTDWQNCRQEDPQKGRTGETKWLQMMSSQYGVDEDERRKMRPFSLFQTLRDLRGNPAAHGVKESPVVQADTKLDQDNRTEAPKLMAEIQEDMGSLEATLVRELTIWNRSHDHRGQLVDNMDLTTHG